MKNELFKSLKNAKLSKEVVKQILSSIKENKLRPGDKLPPEQELCKIFDVSRGTIREAMKSLETFGVVIIKHGSGTFISELNIDLFMGKLSSVLLISEKEINDLMIIRKLIETFAAEEAAVRADDDELLLIEVELEGMKNNLNNHYEFIKHDINFHILIAKSSKNSILPKILEVIRLIYKQQQIRVIAKRGAAKTAYNFHKKIYKAIKNKDKNSAKKLMNKHLNVIEKLINTDLSPKN